MRRLFKVFRHLVSRPVRYRVVLTHRYASGPFTTAGWPTSRREALVQFADTVRALACDPYGRSRVRVLPVSECERLGIR